MTLQMQARETSTQSAMSELRAKNQVPGIIYGTSKKPQAITLSSRDLQVAIQEGGFFTNLLTVSIDGTEEKVLPGAIQYHPVNNKFMHIDFQRFDKTKKVKVEVNVRIIDEELSPGVKIGGLVQIARSTIEVLCRADNIPAEFEVSVAGLNIGGTTKISSITMPEGVETVIQDRDFTLASIISTRSSNKSDEDLDAGIAPEGAEEAVEGEEVTEETKSEK